MVLCLVTLTDLKTRRAGFVSISFASSFLRDSMSFELLRVKICPGLCSLPWSEKKYIIHKKVIIHPIAHKAPMNEFSPNLEQMFLSSKGPTTTNRVSICSRVSILQGVKLTIFS